jgi:serine protease AprX
MKTLTFIVALACAAVVASAAAAPRVTAELASRLEEVGPDDLVRILVVMESQMPQERMMALTEGLPRAQRRLVVAQELSRLAAESQREVLAYLNERAAAGRAADVTSLWIVNAVAARADRETVEGLAGRAGVSFVGWDKEVPLEDLLAVVDGPQTDEIVWGVNKINAPKVWNAGYNGTGVVVCVCDTGVNYNHLDLKDHMWNKAGYPNHGRNFAGGDPNDTMDRDGHGTHGAGTVAADGTAGSQCGVAPEATIMIAKIGNGEFTQFNAWQWAISEGADIITESFRWTYVMSPHYAQHRQASEALLAAGIFHANAAGNEGDNIYGYPLPFNVGAPANCPPPWRHPDQTLRGGKAGTVAVGSTDDFDYRVASSSRGPASWDKDRHANIPPYDDYHWNPGMGLLKPDVMAPGLNIKSCDYENISGYTVKGGTSMATPHVAGAAALLLDYLDTLPPAQLQKAFELTAAAVVGQTEGRKENDYGAGRIDVYEALQHLLKSIGVDLEYFRAAGLDDRVRLSWDCEPGAYAGFNLYRSVPDGPDEGRAHLNAELITGRPPFAFVDRDVAPATTYEYWLEVIPTTGKAELFGPASATPGAKVAYGFALEPGYPNPARARVNFAFSLPRGVEGDYTLLVYDLAGRKVRTVAAGPSAPGRREVEWNLCDDAGRRLAPGVYLYWLRASCGSAARRLVVTR